MWKTAGEYAADNGFSAEPDPGLTTGWVWYGKGLGRRWHYVRGKQTVCELGYAQRYGSLRQAPLQTGPGAGTKCCGKCLKASNIKELFDGDKGANKPDVDDLVK